MLQPLTITMLSNEIINIPTSARNHHFVTISLSAPFPEAHISPFFSWFFPPLPNFRIQRTMQALPQAAPHLQAADGLLGHRHPPRRVRQHSGRLRLTHVLYARARW